MQTKNTLNLTQSGNEECKFTNNLGALALVMGLLLVPNIAQSAAASNVYASIGGNGGSSGNPGHVGIAVGGVTAGGDGGDGNAENGQSVPGGGAGGAYSSSGSGGGGGAASISITNQNNGAVVISMGGNGIGGSGGGGSGSAEANNNTNTAGTETVYGGVAISQGGETLHSGNGGDAMAATAISNTVNMTTGNVTNIYSGVAVSKGGITNGGVNGIDNTATASNNNINISGGTVTGNISGGMVLGNSNSVAENNTITISGATNLTGAKIFGGAVIDTYNLNTDDINNISFSATPIVNTNQNTFNGNVLHLNDYRGTGKVGSVFNFERYDFTIGNNVTNGATILQVGSFLPINDGTGASAKRASIGSISVMPGSTLTVGDSITLIDFDYTNNAITNAGGTVQGKQGAFMDFTWQVNQKAHLGPGQITATVTDYSPASTSGVVANSHTGTSTALLGNATHVLVSNAIPTAQAMSRANASAKTTKSPENIGMSSGSAASQYNTWTPFTVLQAGHNSFNSGVKTDINSLSFVGGLANNTYHENNQVLFGAFIETGIGSYDTSADEIDSDGNVNYVGGGVFSRYEWHGQTNLPYAEISGRLGSLNTDYDTNDIIDPLTNAGVSYKTNSMYYGMHIGTGYILDINDKWDLDLSAKYFWTRQEAIDKYIAGNNFNFDAINSHIVRVGATANYETITKETYSFSPYVGLHYEHEFDSKARASVDGLSIPNSANLKGGTGVISLGGVFAYTNGLSLNGKIEGSFGERDGIIGMLEAKYAF